MFGYLNISLYPLPVIIMSNYSKPGQRRSQDNGDEKKKNSRRGEATVCLIVTKPRLLIDLTTRDWLVMVLDVNG